MIVYGDTSALVKLFVSEKNSTATRRMLQNAQAMATGILTRAELGAALARGERRGLLSKREAQAARLELERVWPTWIVIAMDEVLVLRAGHWLGNRACVDMMRFTSLLQKPGESRLNILSPWRPSTRNCGKQHYPLV